MRIKVSPRDDSVAFGTHSCISQVLKGLRFSQAIPKILERTYEIDHWVSGLSMDHKHAGMMEYSAIMIGTVCSTVPTMLTTSLLIATRLDCPY